jgi:hypothetical protein
LDSKDGAGLFCQLNISPTSEIVNFCQLTAVWSFHLLVISSAGHFISRLFNQLVMGENLKVARAKFSTLSWAVFVISKIARHTQARPRLELKTHTIGLYHKHNMIINDDAIVVSERHSKLKHDLRL